MSASKRCSKNQKFFAHFRVCLISKVGDDFSPFERQILFYFQWWIFYLKEINNNSNCHIWEYCYSDSYSAWNENVGGLGYFSLISLCGYQSISTVEQNSHCYWTNWKSEIKVDCLDKLYKLIFLWLNFLRSRAYYILIICWWYFYCETLSCCYCRKWAYERSNQNEKFFYIFHDIWRSVKLHFDSKKKFFEFKEKFCEFLS